MGKKAAINDEKIFFISKDDKHQLLAMHFSLGGAKVTAQAAINAVNGFEKQFNDKITEIRANLGITEKDNLAVDLDAGTIKIGK